MQAISDRVTVWNLLLHEVVLGAGVSEWTITVVVPAAGSVQRLA